MRFIYSILFAICSQLKAEWIQAELTAYSPTCSHCTSKRRPNGLGAAGHPIKPGLHLAADKSIPFGTRVYVQGRWWIVADRGGRIHGNRLDLAFPSHKAAKAFGVKRERVWIER